MERKRRDNARDAGKGMSGCRSIAMERSELAYRRENDEDLKTEEVRIGDNKE